jgi:elongation factor P
MASTADFRNGMTLVIDGDLYWLVEFLHVKPGKGGAFVRSKLKNVKTGRVIDKTFRAGEKVEEARLDRKNMQFLYSADEQLYFMDMETYEQISLDKNLVGDGVKYLKEGDTIDTLFWGDIAVGVELPLFVELAVASTVPGIKGDTASGGSKPATLETGAEVQVPLFIQEGETLKIDTRTGAYIERVR